MGNPHNALQVAARAGKTNKVKEILTAKQCDINEKTERHKWTALMLASEVGQVDAVKCLLTYTLDINAQNSSGRTALAIAASKGQTRVVKALLRCKKNSADQQITDENGRTALELAWEPEIKDLLNPVTHKDGLGGSHGNDTPGEDSRKRVGSESDKDAGEASTSSANPRESTAKPEDNIHPEPRESTAKRSVPKPSKPVVCKDDNDENEIQEPAKYRTAKEFMRKLEVDVHPMLSVCPPKPPVRVAIIDTGAIFNRKTAIMTYDDRIKEYRTWVGAGSSSDGEREPTQGKDDDGHGTFVTSVLLDVDPFCEVYIARISETREALTDLGTQVPIQSRIANAMLYAITKWRVNIISMSFGFKRLGNVTDIETALLKAQEEKVLILAAASNVGGLGTTSWPARDPTVLAIYATDGSGCNYPRNPEHEGYDDRFATLGVAVEAWAGLDEQKRTRSGTSVATPVAAGLASLILNAVIQSRGKLVERGDYTGERYGELLEKLGTFTGMRAVFRKMARPFNGNSFLNPSMIFDENGRVCDIARDILRAVENR